VPVLTGPMAGELLIASAGAAEQPAVRARPPVVRQTAARQAVSDVFPVRSWR